MKGYLLDTSICVFHFREHREVTHHPQIRLSGKRKYFYKWGAENRVKVSNGGMGVKYASFEYFASR